MHHDTSSIRAYDQILDQIIGRDDLDDISEAESLVLIMVIVSDQDVGMHLVVPEDPHRRADIFLGAHSQKHVAGKARVVTS